MRSVVVYESMFGNTHELAERIADTLSEAGAVKVIPTKSVTAADLAEAELLVVGGPTHVHGMTSKSSRRSAAEMAAEDETLDLDDDVGGPGLREWIKDLPSGEDKFFAAFDTRVDKPEMLTGSAARGIARRLRRHGYTEMVDHESFVLDGNGPISDRELDRARAWGHKIAGVCKALDSV